ncbi:hypothetical protein [Amycolatopsis thermoflava]|uniref:hypothetical protein n=1 Tax=Amycolatopsis thermoflava TaxID=84480 RepID=UPI003F4A03DE
MRDDISWGLCEEGAMTVRLEWREPVVIARPAGSVSPRPAGLVSPRVGTRQAGTPRRRMGERS